jgi:hypothetical protein
MTIVMIVGLLLWTGCAPSARGREVRAQASPAPGSDAMLEGTLEVLVEDSSQGSRTLYFLMTDDMRVALRFSRTPSVLTGARLRVQGRWAADGAVDVTSFDVITR